MNFTDYLTEIPPKIDYVIKQCLDDWSANASKINSELDPILAEFIKASDGGKRLRGALIILGYELAGNEYTDEILKASAAIEIFQTAILAHDDIIDQSPLRRGKPTIYKALGQDHYAISQTICLGDMGFFLGVQLIAESDFPADRKNKALAVFSKMVINTGLGEMLDVELPRLPRNKTEDAVLAIHKLKTAYYTIIYPLTIGGILGGASEELIQKFEHFGNDLGIAFQIQDDILGVFGSEKELGKSVTSDIEEGKNTLLITQALKNANPEQEKILDQYYGKGKVGEEELAKIRTVFEQTGSLEYSKQKALEYVNRAKLVIPEITKDQNYQSLLSEMADFLIFRSK